MAYTEAATGTQAATISTEHTLDTDTTDGAYVGRVNLTNMVSGDAVTLRIYIDSVLWDSRTYYDAQAVDSVDSHPAVVANLKEWKLTLQQTAGTGRNFAWATYRVS